MSEVALFGASGFRPTDTDAVGLPALDLADGFAKIFAEHLRPRLDKRATGFERLFESLARQPGPLLIVETGTLRIAGNWEGDGQSSVMFDLFAQAEILRGRSVSFLSVDLSAASIGVARAVCSHATTLLCTDSVHGLHTLSRLAPDRRIGLLYLDSFDLDVADPMPSAQHHLMELTAAAPMLGPGSLVMVDDYDVPGVGALGGKGLLVDAYMGAIGATALHTGYAKLWRLP